MTQPLMLLSIPGLRDQDMQRMPALSQLMQNGSQTTLIPSFPCVTWPVQANLLTGKLPAEHGVIGNGFYWRDKQQVEMWTAWNEVIQAPQLWDRLHDQKPSRSSAVWFPMLSKGCGADYICMPAPIHNPDGSESLWCYTKPVALYGELRDGLGHFPLQHFWGPLANILSTDWICRSAALAAVKFQPDFFYLYLPHLDYAAQKSGPDGEAAVEAVGQLDQTIGELVAAMQAAYPNRRPVWLAASEYVITPIQHVSYPNRMLREAELLSVSPDEQGREQLDFAASRAWALVDHQFSHVFVKNADANTIARVEQLFRGAEGMAEVLAGGERSKYQMHHERSGEVILVSEHDSWQAYYWWLDDAVAPQYARTVDIHRKPGYDPVELHFDPATRSIPLDATCIRGSHGAPATRPQQQGILACSQAGVLPSEALRDIEVAKYVLGIA